MSLVEHLRTAAKIARERDQLTAIPNGLEAAAERIETLETENKTLKMALHVLMRMGKPTDDELRKIEEALGK